MPVVFLFYVYFTHTQSGNTALHRAAQQGRTEVCLYLTEKGADLTATDKVTRSTIIGFC